MRVDVTFCSIVVCHHPAYVRATDGHGLLSYWAGLGCSSLNFANSWRGDKSFFGDSTDFSNSRIFPPFAHNTAQLGSVAKWKLLFVIELNLARSFILRLSMMEYRSLFRPRRILSSSYI